MNVWAVVWSVASGLVANEICDVSPWAARKLVRWSAHLRYTDPERASVRAEELAALIDKRPGNLFKLITAILFAVNAVWVATNRRVEEISNFRVDPSPGGALAIVASGAKRLVAGAGIAAFAILTGSRIVAVDIIAVPAVGSYSTVTDSTRTTQIQYLQDQILRESDGNVRYVNSAVYKNGGGRDIIEFSGGNWAAPGFMESFRSVFKTSGGSRAAGFMRGFRSVFKGAFITRPGSPGGRVACVDSRTRTGDLAECVWADKDSFGVLASPTMSALRLAQELRDFRPQWEQPSDAAS